MRSNIEVDERDTKARALRMAKNCGADVGKKYLFTTFAEDHRELELAFLEGFLETRDRDDARPLKWRPKED